MSPRLLLLAPFVLPLAACGSAPPASSYEFAGIDQADGVVHLPGSQPSAPPANPGFTPRSDEASEVGRLIVDCDMHLRAWIGAMAAPRDPANQEMVIYTTQALGILVAKNRALLEAQAVSAAPRNRAIASAALGFGGDATALPLLMNNVSSEESDVVAKALLGVGVLSSASTPIAPIHAALQSPSATPEVESNAAFALFQLSIVLGKDEDGTMTSTLLSLLSSPQDSVRSQAALGLGLVRANLALPQLNDLLAADPNPDVRTAAAYSLGQIGSTASTGPLVAALRDPSELTSGAARAALARIHGQDLGPDPDSWRQALAK